MALPIRIHVDAGGEALELASTLARRGLTAAPRIDPSGGWNVVVHYEREETEWLLRDVLAPLELWMADQGLDSVAVQVGEHLHVVGRAEQPYRAAAAAA